MSAACGLIRLDYQAQQPGGGGGRDELAGEGDDQRDEALGEQGDERLAQAGRSGGGLAIDRDERFHSMTVTEMISSWEEMEEGGDGRRMSLPIGMEEEGGRRRKSQKFQNLCNIFEVLDEQRDGQTDKHSVGLSSFSDVASTLLGPSFGVGGQRPRRKLQFNATNKEISSLSIMVNEVMLLASPSANRKRDRSPQYCGGGAALKKVRASSEVNTHFELTQD